MQTGESGNCLVRECEDDCEHNGVRCCLHEQRRTRRQRYKDTRGQNKEQNSCIYRYSPHFFYIFIIR